MEKNLRQRNTIKSDIFQANKSDLSRILIHLPLGILTVLFGFYISWWLAVIFAVGFLVYELDEDWHISDEAYKDIKGWLWGVVMAGLFLLF